MGWYLLAAIGGSFAFALTVEAIRSAGGWLRRD